MSSHASEPAPPPTSPSREEHHVEVRREALTMALYVSIALLAALALLDEGSHAVLAVVWGTALGLALAHFVAFELAARLADPDHGRRHVGHLAAAQAAGAAGVCLVVSAVVLVVPQRDDLLAAELATVASIALVVIGYARAWSATWTRSILGAAVAVALAAVAAGVKVALGH